MKNQSPWRGVLTAGALALALAIGLAVTPAALAVTSLWTTTDGTFNTAGNWDIGTPGLTTNWVISAPGSTYTVTWSATATNYAGALTGANQNVTFDLGGFTNVINEPVPYRGDALKLGNPGDNITLTVSNGTIKIPGSNPELMIYSGNTLVITNGGRIYTDGGWISAQAGATMLMSGPGSYGNSEYGGAFEPGATGIVNNAAALLMTPTGDSASLWLIDGGSFTNRAGGGMLTTADSTIRVINGGQLAAREGDSSYFLHLGFGSGNSSRLIVGNDGPVSLVREYGIVQEWDIYDSTLRGNTDVIVSTNGVVQIRRNPLPWVMYRGANSNVFGRADWRVRDGGYVTLRGGAIAMNTNAVLGLADNNPNTSGSSEADTAILRGFGTISNYNAGANFKVLNHGVIRPGDYGYEVGTHSNIAALGAINIVRGDLLMTNPLAQVGSAIHFEFGETGLDQITISGGSALITGGSNIFTLAAGSAAPAPGVKWGLGTYDFLVASNIVWQPEYADLTNALAGYGLVQNLDYRFGVVDLGTFQALRLEFVPEPSTVMLCLVGGLLLWRLRSRRSGAAALAIALALSAGSVRAQFTTVWTTTDGIYNADGNWNNGAPKPGTNFVISVPNTTYTITWSGTATNYSGMLTGANQVVTFDLGGYTQVLNQAVAYRVDEFQLGNPGDNITLTVSNGTIKIPGTNPELMIYAGNHLIVTNGGRIVTDGGWISAQSGATMLLSGPGSYGNSEYGGAFEAGSTGIVNNGAAYLATPSVDNASLWLIDGGIYTNRAGGSMVAAANSTIRVINGGLLVARTGDSSFQLSLGFGFGHTDSGRLIVGNDGPVSMVSEYGIVHESDVYGPDLRGNTDVIVSTNGVVQVRGNPLPHLMYYGASSNLYGRADWRVRDGGYITLRGGAIAMNTNTTIGLTDFNATTRGSSEAGTGILRGFGTISNYNAGANFKVLNHGVIRPGDYGYEVGTHSNIAALGAINIVRGDLLMTNPLAQVGSAIHFEFGETGLDQITISGGSALITGGSNIFTLAAGSAAPAPGVKWGLGTYDFLVASNIVWQPEYADLTNALAGYGLVQNLDYRFGVVDLGTFQALRLEFVPEPSTVMLCLVGGLLLWRRRGRPSTPRS